MKPKKLQGVVPSTGEKPSRAFACIPKPVLAIGFVLAWIFVSLTVLQSPSIRAWIRACRDCETPEDRWQSHLDPPKGSKIELPLHDALGRTIQSRNGTTRVLVVAAGSCSECTLNSLKPLALERRGFDLIVLIAALEPNDLPDVLTKLPACFRVVTDPHRSLATALNAAWTPRFYLADSKFRLLECQWPGTMPKYLRGRLDESEAGSHS